MTKKVFIKSFGCQMNVRDSEFVAGMLIGRGYALAASPEKADIVLMNTCSVRKHAEDRAMSNLWDLEPLKKKKPGMVIGVIGCMAQEKREKLFKEAPFIDFICGPDDETRIPEILKNIFEQRGQIAAVTSIGLPVKEYFPTYRKEPFKAHVSIGRGCNNYCSYCIVPFVRGKERSRSSGAILKEIKDLARRGFKEVMLLGQNVNSYSSQTSAVGHQRKDFVGLLKEIDKIKGIQRVRFMTSHPKDASIELFKAMRDLGTVCEHLHLPIQSGSDRILKLMNRGYTASRYEKLAESYRKYVPDGTLTTDIIVGFPTESEGDFRKTKGLMERIGFDAAFIFKYSPRPPSRAVRLKDDVPEEDKKRRNQVILDMQRATSAENNTKLIGSVQEVLVEGTSPKSASQLIGRTRGNRTAIFAGGRSLIGKLVTVTITGATCQSLFAKR